MKILKSKKALSPVVASIILIAVTVAVSIAVAAWMGALTFTFMGTEKLEIQTVTWSSTGATLNVKNSGTKQATIVNVKVNYGNIPCNVTSGKNVPIDTGKTLDVVVAFTYTNGTQYDITVVTAGNNEFTRVTIGGHNIP